MKLYADAAKTVREYAEAYQSELDKTAAMLRAETIARLRADAMIGIDADDPRHPICALVAQTLTVGRDSDGYPEISIPKETQAVIRAALDAGIITPYERVNRGRFLLGKIDFTSLSNPNINDYRPQYLTADYDAWNAAKTFRAAQSWQKL
jgi:hypothetical protein